MTRNALANTSLALQTAVKAYELGDFSRAQRTLETLLQKAPGHFDAVHLLGVVLDARGEYRQAINHLQRAVNINKGNAEAWNNLGSAYRHNGDFTAALGCFETALRLAPNPYRELINSGHVYAEVKRFDEAHRAYTAALAARPNSDRACFYLGITAEKQQQNESAIAHYRRALELNAEADDARFRLALNLLSVAQPAEAETLLRLVTERHPDDVEANFHLAKLLLDMHKFAESIPVFRHVTELSPTHASAFSGLGAALFQMGQQVEAEAVLRAAVELAPNSTDTNNILGVILHERWRLLEAGQHFIKSLEANPDNDSAWNNLGLLHKELGNYKEAETCWRKALSISPDSYDPHNNLGMLLLSNGQLSEGWTHHLYRPSLQHAPSMRPPLLRLPDDLNGCRILLRKEQGIGDELFFLRFAPLLKARGAYVAYHSTAKIAPLLARCTCLDLVYTEPPYEGFDYKIAVGDLPLLLGCNDIHDLPPPLPLQLNPHRLSIMRGELAALGPPPYFGITWRAGVKAKGRRLGFYYKEIPISALARTLATTPATLVLIQRSPIASEIEEFVSASHRTLHDFSRYNDHLEDMLALLELLDENICVSNTNVHLRAGLGKPSRVLTPFPPDWRWMRNEMESPWFPGSPTFRQMPDRRWDEAFGRLGASLTGYARS